MTRRMVETTLKLMEEGAVPSVSDVAEAAEVSRATAYRYFPSQAAMIQAAVDEALGPVLGWKSDSSDAGQRVADLIAFAYPRMESFEAVHRAALWLALDQWSRRQAGTLGGETRIVRGNRKALLRQALAPLAGVMDAQAFDKAAQSLSLIFGIEAIVVLKDIWGLDDEQARKVAQWASAALVEAAISESSAPPEADVSRQSKSKAATRPRKIKGS